MTTARLRVSGPLPPEQVWERYADPRRWSSWSPQIRRVDHEGERIAAGDRGRVHGPAGLGVAFVVDAVDERARTWSWTVRPTARGPQLHLHHAVSPRTDRDDGPPGTTTTLVVQGPAVLVWAYLPVAGLALARLVRRHDGRG